MLPKLYKKTSTGAIQEWSISVKENEITTRYGQLDSANMQSTTETIKAGKNKGRSNETTANQQAELEAKAQWEKKLKNGYVQNIEDAIGGKTDASIEGGVLPMLAHKFTEHGNKIKFPCYGQPKLDGIRCVAILKDGKCTLWSRTRKPITGVPHIAKAIEQQFDFDVILDGEAYSHLYKNDFEKIVSFVRQETPIAGHEVVQYHIYDYITDLTQSQRAVFLNTYKVKDPLVLVKTVTIENEIEMAEWFQDFRKQGYEGLMLRNSDGLYVNKRSYDLQKVKEFEDAEFKIVGIDEGKGKLAGHVGSFVCETKDGKLFNAKMKGDLSNLKKYFDDHSLWKGKLLTVQFQGYTVYDTPRFPVGLRLRDDL